MKVTVKVCHALKETNISKVRDKACKKNPKIKFG
jgi:hypothetical protein